MDMKMLGMKNIHCIKSAHLKRKEKERKNVNTWINSRLDTVKESFSELEESSEEYSQSSAQKKREKNRKR